MTMPHHSSPPTPNLLLRRAREARGWSQAQVAEQLGINAFTVCRWERGHVVPRPYFRQQLCTLFGLTPEALGLLPQRAAAHAHLEPPALPAGAPGFAAATVPAFPAILPPRPFLAGGLVGREALLQQLRTQLLSGGPQRVCALQGLPGVGKTSLALELAHDPALQAHFQGGVLWAGVGRTPHLFETLSRWGRALGLSPEECARLSTLDAWAEALHAAFGMRRCLLILDDVWQSEDALACQVGGPLCGYLLTTRFLSVALEVAGAGVTPVAELSEAEGLELLGRLAKEPMARESAVARRLVQAVGGLPLALTLMGRYLERQAYSGQPRRLQAALDRLSQRTERLQLSQPQAPLERHPSLPLETPLSLQASIGLSVAALEAPAQAMLQALAIFPPKPISFPEDAALRVADVRPETLDVLVDAGLVESRSPGRYALHQTIVDYTRAPGEPVEAAARFVAWAADGVDTQALDQELPLILAAFNLAAERGFRALLIRGMMRLAPLLEERGLFETAERLLMQAESAAQTIGDVPGRLRIMHQLAEVMCKRGEYARAEALAREGIALARAQQAQEQLGALLHIFGIVARKRGAYEAAEQALSEALALAKAHGDTERATALLSSLASLHIGRGDVAHAEAIFQEALSAARARGDQTQLVTILSGLAGVAFYKNEYQQTRTLLQEALALARALGTRERMIWLLNNLGALEMTQRHLRDSERALAEGLMLAREMGYHDQIATLLESLGEVLMRGGRSQEAYAACQEGLALARALGQRERAGSMLLRLADIALLEGAAQQAENWLQEGLLIAQELEHPLLLSQARLGWGNLEVLREDWEAATAAYHAVAAAEQASPQPEQLALADYGLARVAAGQGKWQEAHQYGQASLQRLEALGAYDTAAVRQWLEALQQRWAPVSASEGEQPVHHGSRPHA